MAFCSQQGRSFLVWMMNHMVSPLWAMEKGFDFVLREMGRLGVECVPELRRFLPPWHVVTE